MKKPVLYNTGLIPALKPWLLGVALYNLSLCCCLLGAAQNNPILNLCTLGFSQYKPSLYLCPLGAGQQSPLCLSLTVSYPGSLLCFHLTFICCGGHWVLTCDFVTAGLFQPAKCTFDVELMMQS